MSKLAVFVSWSDKRSFLVAEELVRWLPGVLRNVDTFWSDKVPIGEALFDRLNRMLRQADLVVLCLTPENVTKTWINYEAGVVFGKTDKEAKVCPYLIETDPNFSRSKLPTPLAHFEGVMADKSGTRKLVGDINEATESPLSVEALNVVFNKKWLRLKRVIDKAIATPPPQPRVDPAYDFMRVSRDIECHHDKLEANFFTLIDQTVEEYQSHTYSFTKTLDSAHKAIEESKDRYKNRHSILVGNVHAFFVEHFKKTELRKILKLMEADMRSSSGPVEMREKLVARMKSVLLEVFSRYHRTLQIKLDEYINRNRRSGL